MLDQQQLPRGTRVLGKVIEMKMEIGERNLEGDLLLGLDLALRFWALAWVSISVPWQDGI